MLKLCALSHGFVNTMVTQWQINIISNVQNTNVLITVHSLYLAEQAIQMEQCSTMLKLGVMAYALLTQLTCTVCTR